MERRSRLSPEREAEIFAAVVRLVMEHGYENVTMQQVATEARTSTATLYRHWNGKPRLVVEAVRHRRPAPLEDVDTGSLRGDFLAGTTAIVESGPDDHDLMSGLANAARTDPDLDRAQREILAAPMRRAVDTVLDRAAARGEIDADAPSREFVPELLFASLIAHKVHTGEFPDRDYLTRFIDHVVLPALGVRP
ncbi:transcriptional regulator, TetR family [Glycomyces sambucus]|uniref:Transcriptional regulator, TetR family n=1 Tax=Glycomyces sambucus TaxID=380244 RepID=A0A1G9CHS4_9ACTN|nr:TetR/AcrR family transcriptional regulator [Glycomyces sambucus]SDK51190.1 transcriptional regulator, TetR family [Glycomyces sambucus]